MSPRRRMARPEGAIPVLSLWDPWATLVIAGEKKLETRSWSTSYVGDIAIHSCARAVPHGFTVGRWCSLSLDFAAPLLLEQTPEVGTPRTLATHPGHIIGIVHLDRVLPMVDYSRASDGETFGDPPVLLLHVAAGAKEPYAAETVEEEDCADHSAALPYGDFAHGRFAWFLSNVRPVTPVPFTGGQRLTRWWTP